MQILKGYKLIDTGTGEVRETYVGPRPPASIHIVYPGQDTIVCAPTVGEVYSMHKLEPYYEDIPEPPQIIQPITRRQFYQQAAIAGFITQQEAIDAMKGTIPSTLSAVVDQLPTEDDKFNARMILIGAETFQPQHPLVEAVRVAMNLTQEDIDNFFKAAYLL